MKKEISACGENSDCLNKVATKIQKDITTLPDQISASGDEVMMTVFRLKSETDGCCKNAYEDFEAKGTKMYDSILECIKSKFKNV